VYLMQKGRSNSQCQWGELWFINILGIKGYCALFLLKIIGIETGRSD